MQHEHTVTRRAVTTLLLSLVVGARVAGAGTISIAWDPNVEVDVQGYRVYIGTQSGVYSQSVDVGNTTTFTFNNAADGQRYCFAVAAYSPGPRLGEQSVEVCTDPSGNRPPTLTNPGNQSHGVGVALTLQLQGSDPESSPVTYSATGLPAGLNLDTNTGFISGTPTAVGTVSTHATVSDGNLSTTQAFTWTIAAGLPGVTVTLRPTGAIATTTPTFEWESVATATSYRLWVDDASSTDPRIQIDLTPVQAGCATVGAVCHISPGVSLAAGRASWSVRASNASGAGPWSGAMDFSVPDTRVPTVTIATPTTASTFATAGATIALAGTASDDAAVTQVTWTNNKGGSGTATGTASWSVASLPVVVGTNLITVTARDAAGNVATDVLTVTKTDGQGPTLTIAAPASGSSTTAATVAISGSAADEVAVTQVTWISDRGGSGTASGTTAWSIAAVALRSGANVIAVTAHDAAGNKTTKTVTVTLTDGVAPVVTITAPASSAYSTGAETVALGGTASDAFGVTQVTWSNDRGGSGIATGTSAWSAAAVALKSGANVITVTARDAAGNASTDTVTVTMTDGMAPAVAIAVPTASATFTTSAASIAIGGSASDAFGVMQVTWASDKGGAGTTTGTTSWTVAAVPLAIGVNVITVTAKDAAGHSGSDVVTVTRTDGVAPTLAFVTPIAGSTFSTTSTTLALAGTADDNVSVAQVTWSNSKGGNGVATGTTAWSVAGVSLQPGTNVITVTAKDAAGNIGTDVLTVTLTDAVAPVIAIATPTAADKHTTTAATTALGGTASDAFGVSDVRWINDRGGSGVAVGTTSWSIAGLPLAPGANVITVTASDAAGHTSTDRITVTSDGRAPMLVIASPAVSPHVTKAETVTLTGTASDEIDLAEVTWTSNRGGSGRANGTTNWSIPNLTLQNGVNVITVVAQDAAGNRTTSAVSVNRDSLAPTIAVVLPTTAATLITNQATVRLTGKSADDTGVTQVTWQSSRGGAGSAAGTTEWNVPAVALLSGANILTVTARDGAGNVATATLTVTLDTRAPVIDIQTPTYAATFQTRENATSLGGVASDETGLAEVTWTSSQAGSGVATGTATWSAPRIPLKLGLNTFVVTARDVAGNTASATLAVRATDATAPAVRITGPSADATFSTSLDVINLEGTSSDDFGVARVNWSSDRGASGVAKGDARWIVGGITLQPGVNVITVSAVDATGNASTDRVTIAHERGLPTIALTSPTTAATYNSASSNLALTGVATDDSGIARVTFATDKGQVGVATGTTAWSIPSIVLPFGSTTVITVTAHDQSGNSSSVALSAAYVDGAAPVVKFYSPTTAAAFTTPSTSVVIGGTANDNVGVTQVSWANDRGGSGTAFGTTGWSASGIVLAAGPNVITVTARDAAGNAGTAVLVVTPAPASSSKATKLSTPSPSGPTPSPSSTLQSPTTTSTPIVPSLPTPDPSSSLASSYGDSALASWQQALRNVPQTPPTANATPAESSALSLPQPSEEAPAAPPEVRISAPTTGARFTTTASSIALTGLASHASGIGAVQWTTDRGDGGMAEGTSQWTIPALTITPGTTTITVTAVSASGDMTSTVLAVVRPVPLPKLSLAFPTADSQWTTGTATVALRGTATDNVTQVTWSSDSGSSGVAAGTGTWAIPSIGLREGINRITLTGQDASGRTDRHVLTVTYRPRMVSTAGVAK